MHGERLEAALSALGETVASMAVCETPVGDSISKSNPLKKILKSVPGLNPGKIADDVKNLLGNNERGKKYTEIIKTEKPDVLLVRSIAFDRAWIGPARAARLPAILEVNGIYRNSGSSGLPHPALSAAAERVEREAFRAADRIVVVSEEVKRLVLGLGGGMATEEAKIRVVENGVDFEKFRSAPKRPELVKSLGLEAKIVVGFTGSFQRWHGVIDIVKAAPELLKRNRDIHLLLIGDGPARPLVENLVKNLSLAKHITITGAISHDCIQDYIALFDIAAAPYRAKPTFCYSPMKVFEYMAAGKPVVAPALGQIKKILTDGETGRLYEPDGATALAEAILSLAEDPRGREKMGAQAAEFVAREYTWEKTARKIIDVGKEIVG